MPVVLFRSNELHSLIHDALKMMLILFLMYTIAGSRIKKCHGFMDQNYFVFVMTKHYSDSTMIVVSISHEWHFESSTSRDVSHVSFGTDSGL